MPRPRRLALAGIMAVTAVSLVSLVSLTGCSGDQRGRDRAGDRRPGRRGYPDAGQQDSAGGIPEAPAPATIPAVKSGKRPQVLARASTRALAVDATRLYYGDLVDDGIFAMPKAGGEAVRLARHAPVTAGIALGGDSITWIASPGDSVLRMPLHGNGQPSTLRDRGIFSDVAVAGGEVFITEAVGSGGALIRVTGPTAARLASFEGPPRGVVADGTHAYVITPTRVLRSSHARSELDTVATGSGLSHAEIDDAFVYFLAEIDKVRVVARVAKSGGAVTTVARDVRDAPIALQGGEILFFDAARNQVRAAPTGGGDSRVVVEDDSLAGAAAIAADAETIYVAAGSRESGAILAIPRR